ncbi:uncharacterized protein BX664DRAFT_331544 [Halteromyces radiatus]|uniref:uncharacterized protein n=1 Tax=Halteromyces radiatus TaxID=101107 RepID=UPI00221E3BB8|nr:uncharacterized protein BX664DRAFT_331544 [Halteromyces radiatus]KAI8088847.1 hypothetical protein BX664DRAFT_331544 [Halteromyces radiatus]
MMFSSRSFFLLLSVGLSIIVVVFKISFFLRWTNSLIVMVFACCLDTLPHYGGIFFKILYSLLVSLSLYGDFFFKIFFFFPGWTLFMVVIAS